MTVTMSASCRNRRGPWTFRADIQQSGRGFDVALYEGKFLAISSTENLDRFRGQDNPEAVLFFSRGGDSGVHLFGEEGAGIWTGGQARGQFIRDGHINAVFSGTVLTDAIIFNGTVLGGTECRATDHTWTFARR
jgi:hypothetical protein